MKRAVIEEESVILQSNEAKGPKLNDEARPSHVLNDPMDEMGEFEDQFEDEMEEEIVDAEDSENDDASVLDEAMDDAEEDEPEFKAYLPGQDLEEGEVLDYDPAAYEMYHALNVEWPCLSFDILRDNLGNNRSSYPATTYFVSGTQADKASQNKLTVMKISQLQKTQIVSSDDEDDNSDIDEDPIVQNTDIKHDGSVNRVRAMPHDNVHIVASSSEVGKVFIWDLSNVVKAMDTPGMLATNKLTPMHTISQGSEGYALDWSGIVPGRLISGDCAGKIHLTERSGSGSWVTDEISFSGHKDSVEDLQWSPTEQTVFASCSVDQTIKIWDTRMKKKSGLDIHAHDKDVNVISWNRIVPYLLASGADDGSMRIWDLRNFVSDAPSAAFNWHKGPITSIEWNPRDEAVLAASSEDDQLTLWDFSVEKDLEEMAGDGVEVPPQLMFIHQGQQHMKELHWHKQVTDVVMSTAMSGFNIFKVANNIQQ